MPLALPTGQTSRMESKGYTAIRKTQHSSCLFPALLSRGERCGREEWPHLSAVLGPSMQAEHVGSLATFPGPLSGGADISQALGPFQNSQASSGTFYVSGIV